MRLHAIVGVLSVVILCVLGARLADASTQSDRQAMRQQDLQALRADLAQLDQHAIEWRHGDEGDQKAAADIADDWEHIANVRRHLESEGMAQLALTDAGLEQALANEQAALTEFSAANRSLRSAEESFLKGVQQAIAEANGDAHLRADLVELKAAVLAYDVAYDVVAQDEERDARAAMQRLSSRHAETYSPIGHSLSAAEAILTQGPSTDALLRRTIDNRAADDAVTLITERFAREEAGNRSAATIERVIGIATAAGLLVFLLVALRALTRGAREVQALNGTLAQRNRELQANLDLLSQTRDRLVVSDRMATIGTMAAGVAHEINNPAAYIRANASFIKDEVARAGGQWQAGGELDLAPASDLLGAASSIEHGVDRVAQIVSDLRTFSRQTDDEMVSVDLVETLELALRMAGQSLGHVAVQTDFSSSARVNGNPGRLGQVFLNLIINAAQAMPMTGAANRLRLSTRVGDGAVDVEVQDNGAGMTPDVLKRIFDPFFTTKKVGEGTGLGLSICHGIIQKHGGEILVASEVGVGTTFRVKLPRAAADQEPAAAA